MIGGKLTGPEIYMMGVLCDIPNSEDQWDFVIAADELSRKGWSRHSKSVAAVTPKAVEKPLVKRNGRGVLIFPSPEARR